MANNFAINITAVDKATEVIKGLTERFSKFTKPIGEAEKALGKLGKETGLDKLAKKLGSTGHAAVTAMERLGGLNSSVGALTGIGSVGGVALLARQWADAGNAMTLASYRIGIGTQQLGRLQTEARLAGVSGEAATQGASAMAKNIGDVLSGRNPTMAGYFSQLGIRARYDARGRADIGTAYRDLQQALARAPTAQGKNAILDALGQPEELRRMIENMGQLSDAAADLRPNMGAAATAGTALNQSMARLNQNFLGIGDNAETVLAPGLKKVVDGINSVTEAANKYGQSGAGSHIEAILWGAAKPALYGAAAGALRGAWRGGVLGAAVGPEGILPGAVGGALTGAVVGGVLGGGLGAATTGGLDLLGHAGNAAIKWNNPGNLRNMNGRGFQAFATPGQGLVAAARNLMAYRNRYGLDTINGIAGRWAPPNENNTGAYIQHMSEETGYLPGAHLGDDAATNAALLGAIVRNEQGRQPFTPEQLAQAIAIAMKQNGSNSEGGEMHVHVHAPAGTTATTEGSSPYWPVRLHYSMPTGAVSP